MCTPITLSSSQLCLSTRDLSDNDSLSSQYLSKWLSRMSCLNSRHDIGKSRYSSSKYRVNGFSLKHCSKPCENHKDNTNVKLCPLRGWTLVVRKAIREVMEQNRRLCCKQNRSLVSGNGYVCLQKTSSHMWPFI